MESLKISFSHIPPIFFWLFTCTIVLLIFFSYRRTARISSWKTSAVFMSLKLGALVFLILFLLAPIIGYQKKMKTQPIICFLIDGSRSMGLKGPEGSATRAEFAYQLITSSTAFKEMTSRVSPRYFYFSQGVYELMPADLDVIKLPEGRYTDFGSSLSTLKEKLKKEKVNAFVVLSDGGNNYGPNPFLIAKEMGIPIYTVGIGTSGGSILKKEISISDIRYNKILMVDNLAEFEVTVQSAGMQNFRTNLELRQGDKILVRKPVLLDVSAPNQKIPIQWIPREVGEFKLTVILSPDESNREKSAKYDFTAIVKSPHIRLLYVEGTPRWEFKFLKRALEVDQNIDLTCFLRIGSSKFLQVDSGADKDRRPFPSTFSEIMRYDIIIIGDVERNFLGDDFLYALSQYVSEGSGGLLFLGGKSLCTSNYTESPIGRALPVITGSVESSWIKGDFNIALTKEGTLHPIFNYLEDPVANQKFWSTLPVLSGCIASRSIKLGAEVLAVNPSINLPSGKPAVMVVQNYGKGKVAVWGVDTTWKWKVNPSPFKEQEDAYQKFWGQLFRWLVQREPGIGEVPALLVSIEKDRFARGEPVHAVIQVSGNIEAGISSQIRAVLKTPDGEDINLSPEQTAGKGEYSVEYFPELPGRYELTVRGRVGDISPEQKQVYFTVTQEDVETDRKEMDEAFLSDIARDSGGKYFRVSEMSSIPREIKEGESTIADVGIEKKLHELVYLFGFVGMLSLEWVLRKRRDML